jgi:hypothetical protein
LSEAQTDILGVTSHYINDEWELVTRRIGVEEILDEHTGKEIGKMLVSTMEDYGIKCKVVAITVDNASVMDVAVAETGKTKISCLDHTMQLGVNAIIGVKKEEKEEKKDEKKDDADKEREVMCVYPVPSSFCSLIPKNFFFARVQKEINKIVSVGN